MGSLRFKVWVLLAAVSASPLLLVAALGLPALQGMLEERVLALLELKAIAATREIRILMDRAREDVLVLSRLHEIRDFLSAPRGQRTSWSADVRFHLEGALVHFSKSRTIYEQVSTLDDTGHELARVDRHAGSSSPATPDELRDRPHHLEIVECRDLPDGEVHVSPLQNQVTRGQSVPLDRPMVRYCTGVYGEQPGRLGLVMVNLYGDRILAALDPADLPGAQVALCDATGLILARRQTPGASPSGTGGATALPAAALKKPSPSGARRFVGTHQVAVEVPLGTTGEVRRPDWAVRVTMESAVVYSPVHRVIRSGAGVLGVVLVVTLIVASGLSARVVRPLATLSQEARRLASRASGAQTTGTVEDVPEGADEISRLERDVRWLARALEAHERRALDLQERVMHTEKLALVGQFAAEVAHEVGNPLAAIKATVQSLQEDGAEDDRLEKVVRQIDRIDGILGGLLTGARARPVRIEPMDLGAALREVAGLLNAQAEGQGATLEIAESSGVPRVLADWSHVQQVIFNLLSNGIQAAGPGGTVRAAVSIITDSLVAVKVEDSGPGITAQDRTHLFEPFFTTKPKGTGLGLAVSAALARENGGRIDVDCPPTGGTVFTLVLPAAAPHSPATSVPGEKA